MEDHSFSVDTTSHHDGPSVAWTTETGGASTTTANTTKKKRRRLRRIIGALSFERARKNRNARKNRGREEVAGGDSSQQPHERQQLQPTSEVVIGQMSDSDQVHSAKTTSNATPSPPEEETRVVVMATLDKEDAEEEDLLFFDALSTGDVEGNPDALQSKQPDRDVILLDNVIAIAPGGHLYLEAGDSVAAANNKAAKNTKKNEKNKELMALAPPPTPAVALPANHPNFVPPLRAPPPPNFLPLRFLRAGKGDVLEGKRRYKATLDWRRENQIDNILREPSPHFKIIKKHYPHFFHGRGYNGEPCYYEQPPRTNLKALLSEGASLDKVLRHFIMATEFQWQYLIRDDLRRSIYIIDLQGMRFSDFVGDVVDFVKRAAALSSQHYPERAGVVYVINVPAWFKAVWNVVKPWVDESTLKKIFILRDKEEIRKRMQERIPLENIPREYGGESPYPLGQSPEEMEFAELIEHNNRISNGDFSCGGAAPDSQCRFCKWVPPRSY